MSSRVSTTRLEVINELRDDLAEAIAEVESLKARLAKSQAEVGRMLDVNTNLRDYWRERDRDERRVRRARST